MEIVIVLLITAAAVYLFVTEKFRADLVALLVLGALVLVGLIGRVLPGMHPEKWIAPEEGVSGFSNPATITVAAMFVLSAGLQRTGAVSWMGHLLGRFTNWPATLLLLMMVTIGFVSAFINNTAAVAVFLPLVLAACVRGKLSPSKLLIPLSYASQFGGVCTLVGTSTNLLVSSLSERAGYGAFSMFEFSRLGLIMLGTGILYMMLVSRRLLPDRRGTQLTENYQLGEYITELRVPYGSPLIGKTVLGAGLGQTQDVSVLEILRADQNQLAPLNEPVQQNDLLLVRCGVRELMELKSAWKLEIEPEFKLKDESIVTQDLRLAEVLVAQRSELLGSTLAEIEFRRRYNCIALAIQAREQTFREKLNKVRLRFGDALLLLGPPEEIARLCNDPNFLVLEKVDEPQPRRLKIPVALAIIAVVIGLVTLNIMPILVSSIVGCIALVLTRCLTLEEAYAAIDWKVIFILAGMLPLGMAMEKSGAAQMLALGTTNLVGPFGPVAVLAVLYLLTAVLTEFMSNNACAVLMAPIAISSAIALNVDAKPFLIGVCFAASTSFATPVGYQTNTMVFHPGGYRFTDFAKVGIPLNLIFWILAVYFIPKFWSF